MNDMTMPTLTSDTIYKIDSTGRLRTWKYEVQGNKWRSIAGLIDGAQVVSGWTICTPKSQPTGELQAQFEAEAELKKKLERTYHSTPEGCGTPNFFQPMLAKDFAKVKAVTFPVYEQPKLDGIRCIATIDGLFSRQGKEFLSCPHISEQLAPFFLMHPDLIIDGELYNHELKADFEQIVSIVRKQKPTDAQIAAAARLIEFHVYDIPSMSGGFGERITAAKQNLSGLPSIIVVETRLALDHEQLDADYAEFMTDGYEGQMVRLDKPYEQKRSGTLLKRKEFEDAEFEIVELVEGQGNWAGCAKRATLKLPDGRTFGAGIRGTQEFCSSLLAERTSWVGKQATCRYFTPTGDGIPRFPVVTKFHEGEKL